MELFKYNEESDITGIKYYFSGFKIFRSDGTYKLYEFKNITDIKFITGSDGSGLCIYNHVKINDEKSYKLLTIECEVNDEYYEKMMKYWKMYKLKKISKFIFDTKYFLTV